MPRPHEGTDRCTQAAVLWHLHRWVDWLLMLAIYVLYGLFMRARALPLFMHKWANAWQQTWWIALLGLLLGAVEDICVGACACLLLWMIDLWTTPRAKVQRRGLSWEEDNIVIASLRRMGRFVLYGVVFLASQACFYADHVVLRTRRMRFTTEFVTMYLHEAEAAEAMEIGDSEWAILVATLMPTCLLALFVSWLGAAWINLAEWDLLRAVTTACSHWFPLPSDSKRYSLVQEDPEAGKKTEALEEQREPPPLSTRSLASCRRKLLPHALLLGCVSALLLTTLVVSKLVPSIVAVIALNASLNEPFRLLLGIDFFSTRAIVVTKRMSDFIEHATENATVYSEDSLFRRTTGFHGPLAFDVEVDPLNPPNVLVIVVESLRLKDSRYLLQDRAAELLPPNVTLTPQFDQWAARGIGLSNMWSSWRTSRSLETILFGQLPYDSITSSGTTTGRNDTKLAGLPQMLSDKGYETLFTTGARIDYDDWDKFLPSHGFDEVLSRWDLAGIALNELGLDWGDHMMTYWGMHDDLSFEVLGYLLKERQKDKTAMQSPANGTRVSTMPWFCTHYTISSHVPFDEHPDWYYDFRRKLPDFSRFYRGHEHEELMKNYAEMRYFTDMMFGVFMNSLEASGVLNDTIVIITGDHGQAPERGSATPEQDQIAATQVVGAIVAEGRLGDDAGKILGDVSSHSDLLNTIADIVGVSADGFLQSGIGRSLKRAVPFGERVVYSSNPEVNMAAIQGHTRMQFYPEVSDAVQAYHTQFDPEQKHDLLLQLSNTRLQEIYRICDDGRQLNAYFKHRWDHACILKPEC